jgi:hypothetical protein
LAQLPEQKMISVTRLGQRRLARQIALVLALAAAGCTATDAPAPIPSRIVPKCRIVKNGTPVKPPGRNLPPGDSGFQLTFIRIGSDDAPKAIQALLFAEEPGTFELLGQDGKVIPPGRYRVAIFLGPEGGKDALEGKFGRDNSPIEVEIREGEDLTIELANYP